MTSLGIQAWVLLFNGFRTEFWHDNVMELLEVLRVFGNSYRLASMGGSSGVVFSRFTVCFCRTVVAGAASNLASRRSVLEALRNVRIRNMTANVARRYIG
jgi:hypothetical protein